jgi:hypothetical protein
VPPEQGAKIEVFIENPGLDQQAKGLDLMKEQALGYDVIFEFRALDSVQRYEIDRGCLPATGSIQAGR